MKHSFVGYLAFALTFTLAACGDSDSSTGAPEGTIGSVTDSRDGKTYKTIVIGKQTWMAENLNYDAKNSLCYGGHSENCTKYGRIYTWSVAKTACPSGWHLPTYSEFETLFTAVADSKDSAGVKLKSTSGWNDYSGESGNGTDDYSFSALPGGAKSSSGYSLNVGKEAYFWSSTESDSYSAYYLFLSYDTERARLSNNNAKDYWFSVRCLMD